MSVCCIAAVLLTFLPIATQSSTEQQRNTHKNKEQSNCVRKIYKRTLGEDAKLGDGRPAHHEAGESLPRLTPCGLKVDYACAVLIAVLKHDLSPAIDKCQAL